MDIRDNFKESRLHNQPFSAYSSTEFKIVLNLLLEF